MGRSDLTEIDYLLHSPEDRAGALSFGRGKEPPSAQTRFNRVVSLPALLAYADAVAEDRAPSEGLSVELATQIAELVQPDSALGGARPKNAVEDDESLWIAKFPERNDRWNFARAEAATLALARLCGIHTPDTQVLEIAGRSVVLIRRFDRIKTEGGYFRPRMVSALTILGAGDTINDRARWSYPLLADELRRRSHRPNADLVELYRRMVFNALISNSDDHPRNHALIAPGRDWELSPAYDLMPNPQTSLEKRDLAMAIGRFNRYANRENLLSESAQFRLSREAAAAIIDKMHGIVRAEWHAVMRSHGVTDTDCQRLAGAFVYPGFDLDPQTVLASLA